MIVGALWFLALPVAIAMLFLVSPRGTQIHTLTKTHSPTPNTQHAHTLTHSLVHYTHSLT